MNLNSPPPVQFENEERTTMTASASEPALVRFVMKYSGGVIKNAKEAQIALIGIVVLLFGISVFLLLSGPNTNEEPPLRDPSDYIR